ncbi:MAG TPA: hypothetical protein VL128_09355 [Candidatus Eisenbacteria bacterium]|nr:hypothetical protein [Candidatus Eisenbacteria bacterium]
MTRGKRWIGTILLGGAMLAPVALSGCAARVRYYDQDHHHYRHWNDHENHEYRLWLNERLTSALLSTR